MEIVFYFRWGKGGTGDMSEYFFQYVLYCIVLYLLFCTVLYCNVL